MILQSESGLTPSEYAAAIAALGDPIARVTLEQYSLSLTEQAGGGAGAANTSFDAIVVNDVIVRVWATADTITVEALASEDAGDEDWASQNLTATSIDTDVGLTLASSGDTVRVFWWDGTNIKYFESLDNGTTWGAAQTVYAKSNVHLLAAASLTRLHLFSQVSGGSYRLHVGEYDGSWAETDSDIYWPFLPWSFDAVAVSAADDGAASSSDILAFSTDFPPMIRVGVDNTEITRDYERVRGIAVIRYQNGRWSDHYTLDIVDNLFEIAEREYVRLSSYDDWLFLAYYRTDGDADYSHSSVAVSRSKTGIHWEQPYLLGDLTGPQSILIKRGAHAYILSAEDTWRSPSVGYTGDSRITQDVSDRIISLTSRMGDIQEVQIALANPEGVLDDTSPLGDDVSIQAIIREGWIVGGAELLMQTAIVDIDSISQSLQIPTDHKILVGRDVLARLLTTKADNVQEWESQQISGDDYQGADTSKYSGMHHTAGMLGHWETNDNVLELTSNKTPGVAFHTGVSNAWNGTVRAKCRTSATDSADYAGVVFRAHDYENMWYAVYDADADTVKLIERRLNVDTVKAQSSAMGWDHNTFYGLQVNFRYNQVNVYTSEDFVTYLQLLAYTGQSVSVPGATWGSIPIMAGAMGYLGFGFSEIETGGWPGLPDPPPWPTDPVVYPSTISDWPNEMYAGTWEMGIYYTADLTGPDDPDQPTWTPVNAGLPMSEDPVTGDTRYYIRQLLLDPHSPRTRQYCITGDSDSGDALYRRSYGGTWEPILLPSEVPDYFIEDGEYDDYLDDIAIYWVSANLSPSEEYRGHIYVAVGARVYGGPAHLLVSLDYGDTWAYASDQITGGSAFYYLGNIVAYGDIVSASWNGTGSHGRVVTSTDEAIQLSNATSFDGIGGSAWIPWLVFNPWDTMSLYVNNNYMSVSQMALGHLNIREGAQQLRATHNITPLPYGIGMVGDEYYFPARKLYETLHIGQQRPDALWLSPLVYGFQRVLGDNKIYVTVRNWYEGEGTEASWYYPLVENATPAALAPNGFGALIVPSEDEDKLVLGRDELVSESYPNHIYVMDGDTGTTPTAKSGKDPGNDLTAVSIPYTGAGVCYGGVQPIIPL